MSRREKLRLFYYFGQYLLIVTAPLLKQHTQTNPPPHTFIQYTHTHTPTHTLTQCVDQCFPLEHRYLSLIGVSVKLRVCSLYGRTARRRPLKIPQTGVRLVVRPGPAVVCVRVAEDPALIRKCSVKVFSFKISEASKDRRSEAYSRKQGSPHDGQLSQNC